MALYPSSAPSEDYFNSIAERKVFDKAVESKILKAKDNYLFHSLRVQDANIRLSGEVDYVYLDKEFIFFLEVKGGEVKYDSITNQWWTLGGTKKQDPFKQVCSYLFDIRDKHFPQVFYSDYYDQKLKFGYGVLFPESGKPIGFNKYSKDHRGYSIEYTTEIMYLKSDHDRRFSFDIYLERLKKYWRNYSKYTGRGYNGINGKDLNKIKNYFRTDLVFKVPISEHLTDDKRETKNYTEKQKDILKSINKNSEFGFFINGGPGTGKSIIALEHAYQKALKGHKVLLLCFNKCLAVNLEKMFCDAFPEISRELFEASTLHSLLLSNLKNYGFEVEVTGEENFWPQTLPELFKKAFTDYKLEDLYDYIIIDEGQDIFRTLYMDCIELLLKGGWDSKAWVIFMDREFQTIYSDFDGEYLDLFKKRYQAVLLDLDLNCRNTPSIVKRAHIHTGLKELECIKKDRLRPELKFYDTFQDLFQSVEKLIDSLSVQKIKLGSISVLANNNIIEQFFSSNSSRYILLKENACRIPEDRVTLSTPHSFKGLENDFIIYTGRDHFNPEDSNTKVEYYISYTRAKTQLYLFFNESIKKSLTTFSNQIIKADIKKKLKQ